MVGIVLVSHSAAIAEGAKELSLQMAQGDVRVATAGGIDDPDNPIGTDPTKVMAAIKAVDQGDGVLVLMDLGSALLSAEVALDMLPEEETARVRLCSAPIIEGAVAAVLQASLGVSLEVVAAEALTAFETKKFQLADSPFSIGEQVQEQISEPIDEALSKEFVLQNPLGIHARPAAKIVQLAASADADVWLEKEGQRVRADSINQVAMLSARYGDTVTLHAKGSGAALALKEFQALYDDNFGDSLAEVNGEKLQEITSNSEGGIAASHGMAVAPALWFESAFTEPVHQPIDDPHVELARLKDALNTSKDELNTLQKEASKALSAEQADIFTAHSLILEDPELLDQVEAHIRSDNTYAERAWYKAVTGFAERYRQLDDPYMQARANDVVDVGKRVMRVLTGEEVVSFNPPDPVILLANDLLPSQTASLPKDKVLGIITEQGGATSHAAIIARSLGIPAVVGAQSAVRHIENGDLVALDGASGRVWHNPSDEEVSKLKELSLKEEQKKIEAIQSAQAPAVTADGITLSIKANIASPADAHQALENGADGVGLFRTEFLFFDREEAPTEEEQVTLYTDAAKALKGSVLTVRTLDVGGDKPLPYLQAMEEDNPFLGVRGVRLSLMHADVFRVQIKALLRVSDEYPIAIMFPMVSHTGQLDEIYAVVEEAKQELRDEGKAFDEHPKLGIMVEVPAAVALADSLAQRVQFFSLGTNDLAQYVMAADRGNRYVSDLSDALQPAVLKMIKDTVTAGNAAGIPVSICGELGGNVNALPVLLGLGLTELSMSAPLIPIVKKRIRELRVDECRRIAEEALGLADAKRVAAFLE